MKIMQSVYLAFVLAVGLSAPVLAADNSTLDVHGGGTEVFANKDLAGVKYPRNLLVDSGGGDVTDSTNHVIFFDMRASGNLATAINAGTATNGATYPASSIGIGGKDGSGNIQPFIMANWGTAPSAAPAPGTNAYQFLGGVATVDNPCQTTAHSRATFTITSAVSTKVIAGTSAKKTYICAFDIVAYGAQTVGVVEGTKVTNECDTGASGVFGDGTAAHGISLPANGNGLVRGNGQGTVWNTTVNADDFCLITSTTAVTTGQVQYVQK